MIPQWLNIGQTSRYRQIDTDTNSSFEPKDDDFTSEALQQEPKPYLTMAMYGLLLAGICMAAITAFISMINGLGPSGPQPVQSCGPSRIEAQEKKCRFDPMSFSWLPPACFDEELTNDFLHREEWHWFRTQMGTGEVSMEEVIRGEENQLFVSSEYHVAHCAYMWRKLHRALAKGQLVDSYIGSYNHTKHCDHMLLEAVRTQQINTLIVTKFPNCTSHEVYM